MVNQHMTGKHVFFCKEINKKRAQRMGANKGRLLKV